MNETTPKKCEGCGAAISPQEIVQRQAGLVQGKLLCPQCVAKKRQELIAAQAAASHAPGPAPAGEPPLGDRQGSVYFPPPPRPDGEQRLALVEDLETPPTGPSKIRSFSEGSTLSGAHHDEKLKRPISKHNEPATRVRTFHGKLTEAGLSHMDEQINEWLDANPEYFIKASSGTVGVFEGKTKEPHLLLTVFY